jgi:hypothetical protein
MCLKLQYEHSNPDAFLAAVTHQLLVWTASVDSTI